LPVVDVGIAGAHVAALPLAQRDVMMASWPADWDWTGFPKPPTASSRRRARSGPATPGPRTTPEPSLNWAFFGLDGFEVESWPVGERIDVLTALVLRDGFTVNWDFD
jgi:hypothetical protein